MCIVSCFYSGCYTAQAGLELRATEGNLSYTPSRTKYFMRYESHWAVISAFKGLRQGAHLKFEIKVSLGYTLRPCLKTKLPKPAAMLPHSCRAPLNL